MKIGNQVKNYRAEIICILTKIPILDSDETKKYKLAWGRKYGITFLPNRNLINDDGHINIVNVKLIKTALITIPHQYENR